MFKDQKSLNGDTLAAKVKAVGLDNPEFKRCMASESTKRIDDDVASGKALGVTGTPTFFVGLVQPDQRVKLVRQFSGAKPFEQFQKELDKWLVEAEKGAK